MSHAPETVYLVDDDAQVLRSLARLLGSAGMAVTLAVMAISFATGNFVDGSLRLSDDAGLAALVAANAYVIATEAGDQARQRWKSVIARRNSETIDFFRKVIGRSGAAADHAPPGRADRRTGAGRAVVAGPHRRRRGGDGRL